MTRRRIRRWLLPGIVGVVTVIGFVLVAQRTAGEGIGVAAHPDWALLAGAFGIAAVMQPLRALAWKLTLGDVGVGFKPIFAASAVGSFLDTVLPGRLGELSKVGVLRVAAGQRWPGFPKAGGSLFVAHMLEALAFCLVGAGALVFAPFPAWVRGALGGAIALAGGAVLVAVLLHRRGSTRLPTWAAGFLAAAAIPRLVFVRVLLVLCATWTVRWIGIYLMLNAVGVQATLGDAVVYMVLTGLANTAPILPGNTGVYQGAAVGALALVGHTGANAVAASLMAPILGSVAGALTALVGIGFYGRRFAELPRAAFSRAS